MEYKEYRTVDKSLWNRGPWDSEPDKVQFTDEETSLPCLIVRGPSGALCGYVGVPEWHPFFGVDDGAVERKDGKYIDVHGGLTFSGFCAESSDEARHICHKPSPGEPDHVWWLGFDCSHLGDIIPVDRSSFMQDEHSVYRNMWYVRSQVKILARQIKDSA